MRRSSGKDPLLVVASLADASADGVDAATLSFSLTASGVGGQKEGGGGEKDAGGGGGIPVSEVSSAGASHASGPEDH